jgi:hypothetical protein
MKSFSLERSGGIKPHLVSFKWGKPGGMGEGEKRVSRRIDAEVRIATGVGVVLLASHGALAIAEKCGGMPRAMFSDVKNRKK